MVAPANVCRQKRFFPVFRMNFSISRWLNIEILWCCNWLEYNHRYINGLNSLNSFSRLELSVCWGSWLENSKILMNKRKPKPVLIKLLQFSTFCKVALSPRLYWRGNQISPMEIRGKSLFFVSFSSYMFIYRDILTFPIFTYQTVTNW